MNAPRMFISQVTSPYHAQLHPLHLYHGMLACPYHADLVFQCPLQVSLQIPSHSSYSFLKYSKVNAQKPVIATNKSCQECVEEMIRENRQIKQKDTALKLGISKEWATLSTFLESNNVVPGEQHEN